MKHLSKGDTWTKTGFNQRKGISPYKVRILALIAFVGWFMFVRILIMDSKKKVLRGEINALKKETVKDSVLQSFCTGFWKGADECMQIYEKRLDNKGLELGKCFIKDSADFKKCLKK